MRGRILKLLLITALIMPTFALASVSAQRVDVLAPTCNNQPTQPEICKDNAANNTDVNSPLTGKNGILNKVTLLLSFVVGVACVIVIMVSGLRFIVASGDSNSISNARRSLLYAVVGLVIAVASRILVRFVISRIE